MRIAVVNWTDRHTGGAETYIGQVLAALDAAGHSLLLWHEHSSAQDRPPIPLPPGATAIDGAWQRGPDGVAQLRAWAPDVIFINGLVEPACEDALLQVAPAAFFAHNYYGTCMTGSKTHTVPNVVPCDRRFGRACLVAFYPRRCGGLSPVTMWTEYVRQSARHAHLSRYAAVLVFSEHMRREYRRHGVADSRLHLVPPIVETPVNETTVEPRTAGTRRLVFAGRLDALKGCRTLIDALPATQSALRAPLELVIAGSGPDEHACREAAGRVARADLRVEMRGWLPKAQTGALLASADLVVMPSLWPEPLGLSGLEALARGIPVTAFAVGGIPEWLEDGITGTLAPGAPPTAAGLAAAMARALTTPAIAARTQAFARSVGGRWSAGSHVRALQAIFAAIVHQPADAAGRVS